MEETEKTNQEEKKGKEKMIKVIATVVGIFVIIILIIIASQTSFPIFWVFGISIIVLAGMLYFWFGFDILKKFKEMKEGKEKEGVLPKAITVEQAYDFIDQQLKSPRYADYFSGILQQKPYVVGKTKKQTVMLFQLERTEHCESEYQFFIINMHYPENLWAYIEQEKLNLGDLMRTVNVMTTDPDDVPDIKITEEESPLTGIKRKITESAKPKKEGKKEEKKEDLK